MKRRLIPLCKKMRSDQTDAERLLWSRLRDRRFLKVKFRRQHPLRDFILDFFAPELNLAIEADGGQHFSVEGEQKDIRRTEKLSALGIRVLRFDDSEILGRLDAVLEAIRMAVEEESEKTTPHLDPLP